MKTMIHNIDKLPPWEALLKKILFLQLGKIKGKEILDFGSGTGFTADYYAESNNVVAVEPSEEMLKERFNSFNYKQLIGSIEQLRALEDETFDVILCHNVLEYADKREEIVKEFYRLLKPDGKLSIIKHNRAGRVIQMVVLLNDFEHGNILLDGKNGVAEKFGVIHYYDDLDLLKWCPQFTILKTYGIRTFWDLQQNQGIQKEIDWQDKMIQIEMRVAENKAFQNIAFFHHILLSKENFIA